MRDLARHGELLVKIRVAALVVAHPPGQGRQQFAILCQGQVRDLVPFQNEHSRTRRAAIRLAEARFEREDQARARQAVRNVHDVEDLSPARPYDARSGDLRTMIGNLGDLFPPTWRLWRSEPPDC